MGVPLLSIKFSTSFSPSFCAFLGLFVAQLVGYSLIDLVSAEPVGCKFRGFIGSSLAEMSYFSVKGAQKGLSCLAPLRNIYQLC